MKQLYRDCQAALKARNIGATHADAAFASLELTTPLVLHTDKLQACLQTAEEKRIQLFILREVQV